MDLIEFTPDVAQRHPWEVARVRFFSRVIEQCRNSHARAMAILDVGAGDGWFSQQLGSSFGGGISIDCWDTGYTDHLLQSRNLHGDGLIRFVIERPKEQYDLILLLDVLEHVSDDASFFAGLIRENLKPGGHVLISVPAWPLLFSEHDRHLRHFRRYTPAACETVIRGAGLQAIRSGGLFHSLLFVRLLQKVFAPRTGAPPDLGQWNAPKTITAVVTAMLRVDSAISRIASRAGIRLPGLSYWALCRNR